MVNNWVVEVADLRVVRGGQVVLPGVTCHVAAGSVVGLLGPSGGGKTTLLRSIVGVQVIESGSVTVLGEPAGTPGLRRRVGYVTQAPSVYADLTVRDNVGYFGRLAGASTAQIRLAVAEVGLAAEQHRKVASLSGGQRSRVSLAAALVGRPELLVLDEPTVGLDPVLRRDLWQLFHELARRGTTLLVSSHVMDEATRCDRLLLLREGRLLADLTPHELITRTGAHDPESGFLALVEAGASA